MTTLTVKFLGGMREEMGKRRTTLSLGQDATAADLPACLQALGIDTEAGNLIITLNGRGLHQWPPDRPLSSQDLVTIFPAVSGG